MGWVTWAPSCLCLPGDQTPDCFGVSIGRGGRLMGYHRWNDLLVTSSVLFWGFMIQSSGSVACPSIGRASPGMCQGGALHFLALGCRSEFCSQKFRGRGGSDRTGLSLK